MMEVCFQNHFSKDRISYTDLLCHFYEKYEGIQQLFIWTIDSPKKLKEISDDCYIITDKAFLLFNSHYNHH